MNALLLLSLFLTAAPDSNVDGCVTKCGLMAPLEWGERCTDLQKYEDSTLAAFAGHVEGWSYDKTCPALKGWTLLVRLDAQQDGSWLANGHMLLGLTVLEYHTVMVGRNDWNNSSLAHELAHVIEHYLANGKEVGNHKDWSQRGICDAVNSVSWRFRNDCVNPGQSEVLPELFFRKGR